jgi:hypothetical protein
MQKRLWLLEQKMFPRAESTPMKHTDRLIDVV